MPATAGRVRMPANNRVHSSAALQTHGIWQSAIGYDPYAPDQKHQADERGGAPAKAVGGSGITEEQQNAYDSFQGLLALARLTGSSADEVRGACKKCGRVGHLTFQCRNFLTAKEEAAAAAAAVIDKERGAKGKEGTSQSDLESEETDGDFSDSDEDPEMERAIAEKFGRSRGKTGGSHGREKRSSKVERSRSSKSSSKRKSSKRKSLSDEEFSDYSSDTENEDRRKRREKREKKKTDRGSDRSRKSHHEEKKRRRRRRYSDDSSESSPETRRSRSHRKGQDERRKERESSKDLSGEDERRSKKRKEISREYRGVGDSVDSSPDRSSRHDYEGRRRAENYESDTYNSVERERRSRKHREKKRRYKEYH
ncbi:hypothetical protein R1flu_005350 [Riccia fluitans]|uniref:CCHC-type domain-containing protein n=1 Tax=Riccia fluitans TaxID=41844 RepID=A0ABD1YSX7_9MARC